MVSSNSSEEDQCSGDEESVPVLAKAVSSEEDQISRYEASDAVVGIVIPYPLPKRCCSLMDVENGSYSTNMKVARSIMSKIKMHVKQSRNLIH